MELKQFPVEMSAVLDDRLPEEHNVSEIKLLRHLPDISSRFLTNTSLLDARVLAAAMVGDKLDIDENGQSSALLTLEQSRQLGNQKTELLKRFLTKKAILTKPESVTELRKLPFIVVERDASGPIRFKVNKVTNKRVPDYLKEDFPSKSLHAARIYCRQINDGISVSPTANQYSQILDNFTMTKGVPTKATGAIGIKPKQKWTDKNNPLS